MRTLLGAPEPDPDRARFVSWSLPLPSAYVTVIYPAAPFPAVTASTGTTARVDWSTATRSR